MNRENNYWLRSRLGRRRFVGGAALTGLGAASLGLVGCGGGDDDDDDNGGGGTGAAAATSTTAPTVAVEQVKKGGTYVTAFTGPFAGTDPHNSVYGGAGIVPVVYNYLLRQQVTPDAAGAKGIIYDLAESHKLEADQLTYTFKLRADAKIAPNSDSVPERVLTSNDVKLSMDRVANKAIGSNGFSFFNTWVDKYDAPDATTFRLVTKKPYSWTTNVLGNNLMGAIVPAEWLVSADIKKRPNGAGPFMLKSLTEGQQAEMVRNPNYYRSGRPYVDNYTIKAYADQATFRTAFQASQTDMYTAVNRKEVDELKNADKAITGYSDPGVGFNSFWMNTKEAPWSDPRVRKAVNLALNRTEYIALIGQGVGEPIGPLTYAFTKEALPKSELEKLQPFDVNQAKTLFQQAGVTEFKFQHPTSSNVADYVNIFVRQMQAAGVTAKPEPLDAGTWVAQYFQSKLTASLSLNQAYQTPDAALQWYHTGGITGNNAYDNGWVFADVDAAIDKAAQIFNVDERAKAYQDAQKLILSKDPAMIHFYGTRVEVAVKNYVKNFPAGLSSLGTAFINDVWIDKA